MPTKEVYKRFGSHCFDDRVMKQRLPQDIYTCLRQIKQEGKRWNPEVADAVAEAMKNWAMENGATHYVHWFTPMTGVSAGKHDGFISGVKDGEPIISFSGTLLIKGESDASSFPSGGLRTTYEGRGYTTWDPTSPAFLIGCTLYIPTAFCGYNGEALDQKTPVLRSMQVLNKQALRVLRAIGDKETLSVSPTVGAEQEYFLVEKELLDKRLDLKICGYTLMGARPPKGQELDDHYYGSISERVRNFMRELDEELWLIGVPAKTEHNEVAPGQYELASIYSAANIALDHNQITMELLRKIALRHNFACLLHEKPYEGVNGSGKHNNWSLTTNLGQNLLEPGSNPTENRIFLLMLCAVISAVHDYSDLLRLSTACSGNDLRLGASEAPPAIISVFLGEKLSGLLHNLAKGHAYEMGERGQLLTGVKSLPTLILDDNDRNRTSPFAFTGNKFEFRMVGSSQSIGLANVVINTTVADVLRNIADRLEAAENIDATIAEIVHDTYTEKSEIIFNGNNYADEWVEEAARRGLPNVPASIDAMRAFTTKKNIDLFERCKVFSKSECLSRYDIMLEHYIKTMRIEAVTLLEMTRSYFLPAAVDYLAEMADAKRKTSKANAECKYINVLVNKLSESIDKCDTAASWVEVSIREHDENATLAQTAALTHKMVTTTIPVLRDRCNTLEELLPENRSPMPGYSALLYGI